MPAARPLCILHANCLDGLSAAAVVAKHLDGACDFLPMQYGDTAPVVEGRPLWMVDFGLPAAAMRALRAQAASFAWLDHHASQVPVQREVGFGIVDTAECGTSLAWRELFPGQPLPAIAAYIKDKDLWTWALPESRAVAAGLWQTFQNCPWDRLGDILAAEPMAMAAIGAPLVAAQARRVDAAVVTGRLVPDGLGQTGCAVYAVPCHRDQNEVAERVLAPVASGGLGHDLAVLYYRKKRNGMWVHSLRSDRIDCQALAARHGGGGHPRSACFIAPRLLV
jgi:uncharacterized protein